MRYRWWLATSVVKHYSNALEKFKLYFEELPKKTYSKVKKLTVVKRHKRDN